MANEEKGPLIKKIVAVKRSEKEYIKVLIGELAKFEGLKVTPKAKSPHRVIIEAPLDIISQVMKKFGSKCYIEDLIEHKKND